MLPAVAILLLVTPFTPSVFTAIDRCLTESYYGTYGSDPSAVFLTDEACLSSLGSDFLSKSSVVPLYSPYEQLIWVEEASVEPALKPETDVFSADLDQLVRKLQSATKQPQAHALRVQLHDHFHSDITPQTALQPHAIWTSSASAIIASSSDAIPTFDMLLPRFWRAYPLHLLPFPIDPVPPESVERIKRVLEQLAFDPDVAAIVNNISIPQMRNDIRFLTGEDGKSGIVSRHSFSKGSRVAATWLKDRFEETGATCSLQVFILGFAPNVICRYQAAIDTTATVIIGAHYDSRGSFGSIRAPGGNDDGSGVIALLAIARVLHRRTTLRFHSNVEIVAFAGEEQGLWGSKAYALTSRKADANVTLMIQADMIGYRVPGEPSQLGLPDKFVVSAANQLVANISAIYSPELTVGLTSACCSDHQSFYEQGFASTQLFERAGRIADPMYHNSGDISDREGYDFEQIKSIAKVEFATLLHVAGYDFH